MDFWSWSPSHTILVLFIVVGFIWRVAVYFYRTAQNDKKIESLRQERIAIQKPMGTLLRVLTFLVLMTILTDRLQSIANAGVSEVQAVSVAIGIGPADAKHVKKITWLGSGFFIEKDLIVSNAHVFAVSLSPKFSQDYHFFALLDKSQTPILLSRYVYYFYKPTRHGTIRVDLACIRPRSISSNRRANFPKLRTEVPEVGTPIRAIGYPTSGLNLPQLTLRSTVTSGIVSRRHLGLYYGYRELGKQYESGQEMSGWFQMDIPIRGGNSGGPVVDQEGRVVGVTVAGYDQHIKLWFVNIASIPTHFNFAVKAHLVEDLVNAIESVSETTSTGIRVEGGPRLYPRAVGEYSMSNLVRSTFPIPPEELSPNGYVGLGNIYSRLGYNDKALEAYSTAALGGAFLGYLMRGLLKEKLGKLGGEADVKKALEMAKKLERKEGFLKNTLSTLKKIGKKGTSHSDDIKKLLKIIF